MKASEMVIGEEYAIRYTKRSATFCFYLGPRPYRQAVAVVAQCERPFQPVAETCANPATVWTCGYVGFNAVLGLASEYRAEQERSRQITEQCKAERLAADYAYVREHFEEALRYAAFITRSNGWGGAATDDWRPLGLLLDERSQFERARALLAAVGRSMLDLEDVGLTYRTVARRYVNQRLPGCLDVELSCAPAAE